MRTYRSTDRPNQARTLRSIPVARVGRPDDIAEAGLFLASDEGSYVNGVAFPVDGGMRA